jgi:RNA polymerase sigma factor (sigma-70 family)
MDVRGAGSTDVRGLGALRARIAAIRREGAATVDVLNLTPEQLGRLLNGDRTVVCALIHALWPHVRLRISKVARGRGGLAGERGVKAPEIDDLCQEAFLELFSNGARVLRAWDPARGLSLPSFAQLVAERVARARLRQWSRLPAPAAPLERAAEDCAIDSVDQPDRRVLTQNRLERVLRQLAAELSPRGLSIFHALFVECRQLDAICEDFALKPDAVYAWRSRLGKRVHAILADLEPSSRS